ncbi:MAG: LPS export ABC transporter periplasmic protein LptC, partial [Lactobacillales bacterium]|nr:LPS export ABC transporter periplasmic protein LptC [Lactobacillales bacterium]
MFTLRLFKIKLHSRRVQVLKRVLPIFAFLFAGVLLVWPTLIEQKDKFSLATKNTDAVNSKINMQGVRFFSLDGKNQPLVVVADSVQETDPNSQIITLEEPKATLKMNNGEVLNSETAYGFAFQKDEYLYFEDEVYSTTDSGWEAYSYRVVVDYKNNIMESDTPVRIIGPAGKLNADGFLLFNNADNINFKGNT